MTGLNVLSQLFSISQGGRAASSACKGTGDQNFSPPETQQGAGQTAQGEGVLGQGQGTPCFRNHRAQESTSHSYETDAVRERGIPQVEAAERKGVDAAEGEGGYLILSWRDLS